MVRLNSEQLTQREIQERQYEKEAWERQAAHQLELKRLELTALEMEAKWASWIKLPLVLITLPVRILMIIPLSIYAGTKQDVPEFYQRFFK